MGTVLLATSICLVVVGLALLACLMLKQGRFLGMQGVWELAVQGNRLARAYVAIMLVAFAVAVSAQVVSLSEKRAVHRTSAAPSSLPLASSLPPGAAPNPSLQRTASGVR